MVPVTIYIKQTCCQGSINRKGACYFTSTVEKHHDEAKKECSNKGSKLLVMSSIEEEIFVSLRSPPTEPRRPLGKKRNRKRCRYRLKVLELYSTLESRIIANSLLDLCQTTCLRKLTSSTTTALSPKEASSSANVDQQERDAEDPRQNGRQRDLHEYETHKNWLTGSFPRLQGKLQLTLMIRCLRIRGRSAQDKRLGRSIVKGRGHQ
ncbi:uncharacterized protein [Hemitrygon akajei]|uniref:uncharacterized protein n=1 Tax=Hemitrygon akajei TaxID=2704970 RepID=UPI003BF969B1